MQYTIVFAMKFTIIFLFALLYIHILSRYGMKDTSLGNAELNAKPIFSLLDKVNKKDIAKNLFHRDDPDVVRALTQFATANIDRIKERYKLDPRYSKDFATLMQKIKKTDTNPKFHGISDYKNYIYKVTTANRLDFIHLDPTVKNKLIEDFVGDIQSYLVQKGILSEKPSAAAIAQKVSSIEHTIPEEKFLLGNTHGSMDTDATVSVAEVSNMPKEFIKTGNKIPKDTKDNMHTHMLLFGILLILCSVALALTLCVAVAYHIAKKKHQSDISYSIGLM